MGAGAASVHRKFRAGTEHGREISWRSARSPPGRLPSLDDQASIGAAAAPQPHQSEQGGAEQQDRRRLRSLGNPGNHCNEKLCCTQANWVNDAGQGFAPDPTRGRCPLDSRQGRRPWNLSLSTGGGGDGGARDGPMPVSRSAIPHPHRSKRTGLQRRLPLLEVQEAKPPGGFQGRALSCCTRRHAIQPNARYPPRRPPASAPPPRSRGPGDRPG